MNNKLTQHLSTLKEAGAPVLIVAAILSTGCATPEKFRLAEAPEVSAATAAELKFRSVDTFTTISHHHVVRIDGQPLLVMEPDSRESIDINAGTRNLHVTCHTRDTNFNTRPHDYTIVDGQTKKTVELAAGDEKCYKVSFGITNCAVITEAEPSYCN